MQDERKKTCISGQGSLVWSALNSPVSMFDDMQIPAYLKNPYFQL